MSCYIGSGNKEPRLENQGATINEKIDCFEI
jgi:hypothetical protein